MRLRAIAMVAGVTLGTATVLVLAGCRSSAGDSGPAARMAPCPDSPNCVSTLSEDEEHGIAALTFEGSPDEAKERLLSVIEGMPRTAIVENDGWYIRAEFTSRIFRFVDDVEFLIDANAGVIDFRSASRVGRSDLGANRKRMETIREAFSSAPME